MNRLAVAVPMALVAALLVGCGTRGPTSQASAKVTPQPMAYAPGTGVVQAVTPAPGPLNTGMAGEAKSPVGDAKSSAGKPGAAAGATAKESGLQRLRIRMDDGRMVFVDTPSRDFQPGTRVQLTDKNEIRRL